MYLYISVCVRVAVTINRLRLVQRYTLSLFWVGPIALQCFVEINTIGKKIQKCGEIAVHQDFQNRLHQRFPKNQCCLSFLSRTVHFLFWWKRITMGSDESIPPLGPLCFQRLPQGYHEGSLSFRTPWWSRKEKERTTWDKKKIEITKGKRKQVPWKENEGRRKDKLNKKEINGNQNLISYYS